MNDLPLITWSEAGKQFSALWRSESGVLPPGHVVVADDGLTADAAYRLAANGTAILWRGDFDNARQMLQALSRRLERRPQRAPRTLADTIAVACRGIHRERQKQALRAHVLGMLLVPLESDYRVPLKRSPDVRQACVEAYGPGEQSSIVSLRELLGLIGAHEWRTKGVAILHCTTAFIRTMVSFLQFAGSM